MTDSPQGRRVLVAVVTGEIGERIQNWRERYDPEQARRLPPHATLCYWASDGDLARMEQQVRYAFDRSVSVKLGRVREFDNADRTRYLEVLETAELDAARERLYDGTFAAFERQHGNWTWHVTCVRYAKGRDTEELRLAADELSIDTTWTIDRVAYLELQGDRYVPLADWQLR
jgi:2'-5' RNA ligase